MEILQCAVRKGVDVAVTHVVQNGPSDCFAACVASILSIPLQTLPRLTRNELRSYLAFKEQYLRRVCRDVLHPRGLQIEYLEELSMEALYEEYPQGISILAGQTLGGIGHAVICQDGMIVWDPAPTRGKICTPLYPPFAWFQLVPNENDGAH